MDIASNVAGLNDSQADRPESEASTQRPLSLPVMLLLEERFRSQPHRAVCRSGTLPSIALRSASLFVTHSSQLSRKPRRAASYTGQHAKAATACAAEHAEPGQARIVAFKCAL